MDRGAEAGPVAATVADHAVAEESAREPSIGIVEGVAGLRGRALPQAIGIFHDAARADGDGPPRHVPRGAEDAHVGPGVQVLAEVPALLDLSLCPAVALRPLGHDLPVVDEARLVHGRGLEDALR